MIEFNYLGTKYRTTPDASLVERQDRAGWTRTGSLRIREAALKFLAVYDPHAPGAR